MAGPGGVEAGRAFTLVLPNVDRFLPELKAYLEGIERKLKLEIPVRLDPERVADDTDRIREQVRKTPAQLPLIPDADQFLRRAQAEATAAAKRIEAEIPLTADGERLRRDLQVKLNEIQARIRQQAIEVPLDVEKAAQAKAELVAQIAELQGLAKADPVEIPVDVDKKASANLRGLKRDVDGVGSSLTTVSGQLAVSAASVGASLATWGPPILVAGGAAAAMAPAVASMVPAVAALGLGAGALAVGFQGVGDALKLAFDPDKAKEFRAALKNLSPAARDAVKAIQGLAKPWKDVRKAVQDALFNGMAPFITAVGDKLFPVLQTALTGMAGLFNTTGKQLAGFLTSVQGLDLLKTLAAGATAAMRPLFAVVTPLTAAFLHLATAATPAFKALTQGVADAVLRFSAFIVEADHAGTLGATISTAMTTVGNVIGVLGRIIGATVKLLVAIGPAAANIFVGVGNAVLQVIAALKPLGPVIAQNKLLFAALGVAVLAFVSPVAAVVAGVAVAVAVFQRFGTQITAAVQPVIAGVMSFAASMQSAFQTVLPAIQNLAATLLPTLQKIGTQIVGIVGPALASIGKIMSTQVAPAFVAFLAAATPVINFLVERIGGVLVAVIQAAVGIIKGSLQIIAGILNVFAGLFTGDWSRLWDGVLQILHGAMGIITSILSGALSILGTLLSAAWTVIVAVAGRAWQAIVDVVVVAVKGVVAAVRGIGAGIAAFAGAIGTAVAGVGSAIIRALVAVLAPIGAAVAAVVSAMAGVLAAAFRTVVSVVSAIWSAFWNSSIGGLVRAALGLVVAVVQLGLASVALAFRAVTQAIGAVWSAFWRGFRTVVTPILAAVRAAVTAAFNAIRAVVTAVVSAVRAVVTAQFNAMRAVVQAVMNAIRSVISSVWNAIRPIVQRAVSAVLASVRQFQQIVGIVGNAFRAAYNAVVSWIGRMIAAVRSIGGRVAGAVSGFGSLLFRAGASLIQGLINGITSKIKAVTGAISAVTSKIKGFLPGSPIKEGPLVSWNNGGAGKKLIGLLADGLQDVAPVTQAMTRVAKAVAAPARELIGLSRFIGSSVSKGLIGSAEDVRKASTGLANRIRDAVRAYSADKSSIAKKIAADTVAVERAQATYSRALERHGKGAARAILSARNRLADAVARLRSDKSASQALDGSFLGIARNPGAAAAMTALIARQMPALERLAAQRAKIADKMKAAQDKLAEAIKLRDDYAKSVKDAALSFASLTSAEAKEGKALTDRDVLTNLQTRLAALAKFRTQVEQLKKMGLNPQALKELIDAGVQAGGATADALFSGGQEAVSQVNLLTQSINTEAAKLGEGAANTFYQGGVDAAQGLVDGLKSKADALAKAANLLADALVAAIKKRLGIKSPSTVMAEVGENMTKGLVLGMTSQEALVGRAADRLKAAAIRPASIPSGVFARPGFAGGSQVHVTVNNPVPETASESTTRVMRRLAVLGAPA